MGFSAKILADTISPSGCRLTTFECTFPRIILAEINTHRVFSRNTASTRAIPTSKIIQKIKDDPFIPFAFGKNQKGMSAAENLSEDEAAKARQEWLVARDMAIEQAQKLVDMGVHKQLAGRLLEPFMYVTMIISATEYDNFFKLRCHESAQPEMQKIAEMMKLLYETSLPTQRAVGSWHMPMLDDQAELLIKGYSFSDLKKISTGRVARVSYESHNGVRDPQADIDLCHRLVEDKHMSPLEHSARVEPHKNFDRNFKGFRQYRAVVES